MGKMVGKCGKSILGWKANTILRYSDATNVDTLRRKGRLYPIYVPILRIE